MLQVIKEAAKAYYRAIGYYPLTKNGVNYKLDPDHAGFWMYVKKDLWEPYTYKILSTFLDSNTTYCDIGSWIGPTSVVLSSQLCKKVICFEPDPTAYRYLRCNIELNQLENVQSFNVALASENGIAKMGSFSDKLGDSTTSLIADDKSKDSPMVDVVTLTWDSFLSHSKIDDINFIKIDIEGGEFSLLPTLKDYLAENKPGVYLSTHAPYLDADERKSSMQSLVEVMSVYDKCLDHNLKPVDINVLTSDDAINNFNSYVFTS